MRPRAKRAAIGMFATFGLVGAAQGCRAPTEAILDITFTGPCSGGASIGIIVGTDPVDAEQRIQRGVFTTTADCVTGKVGTLAVTPNDATGRAAIVVLAGVGKSGAQCLGSEGYKDCIVARRTFTFVEHTSLTIPILLDLDCKDVPCDAFSTCDKKKCATSSIECSGAGCLPPGQSSDGGMTFVDAPTDPDAYVHTDGSIGVDGTVDPPTDSGTDVATDADAASCENLHEPVSCNRTSGGLTVCPTTSHSCCWGFTMPEAGPGDAMVGDATMGTNGYDCRISNCMEQMDQPTVRCLGSRNCPSGQICCRSTMYGGSMCMLTGACPNVGPGPDGGGAGSQQFCEDSCECTGGKSCTGSVLFGNPTMQSLKVCQ